VHKPLRVQLLNAMGDLPGNLQHVPDVVSGNAFFAKRVVETPFTLPYISTKAEPVNAKRYKATEMHTHMTCAAESRNELTSSITMMYGYLSVIEVRCGSCALPLGSTKSQPAGVCHASAAMTTSELIAMPSTNRLMSSLHQTHDNAP
jgi:hypothetical protein